MALVDWLHASCPNVQFIKTTISEKCNKVTISKEINKTIKCAIKRGRPPCAQFLNTLPQRQLTLPGMEKENSSHFELRFTRWEKIISKKLRNCIIGRISDSIN